MTNDTTILTELEAVKSLPSPPQVAMRILDVTQDPEKGAQDLADVLRTDAALSAKVLAVSNSSAYARARKVESVTDAVNFLGVRSVSMLALGFTLKQDMPTSNLPSLPQEKLWQHSIATAVLSRAISRYTKCGEGELCFLCGLLSRVGQLIFISLASEQYAEVVAQSASELPNADEEREVLGVTHHDVAKRLLTKWHLPNLVRDSVVYWDFGAKLDGISEKVCDVAKVLRFADSARGVLFDQEKGEELAKAYALAQEYWGLDEEQVNQLFVDCQSELIDTLRVFDSKSAKELSCEEILDRARTQLVQTSAELVADLSAAQMQCQNLAATNKELEVKTTTDALTGLHNRYALDRELEKLDSNVRGANRPYSLVILDIDHFKGVNDNFGHDYGDEVLREVGCALADCTRATDFVARYGGEEFVVVLPNCSASDSAAVGERFRMAITKRNIELPDGSRIITASAGVATSLGRERNSYADILKRADQALYEAKRRGRNQTVRCSQDLGDCGCGEPELAESAAPSKE